MLTNYLSALLLSVEFSYLSFVSDICVDEEFDEDDKNKWAQDRFCFHSMWGVKHKR